jgi:hypothetical protein
MTPLLMLHIGAGTVGIVSGALAVTVAKGGRNHRIAGRVFFAAMLVMAVLGIFLAIFAKGPPLGAAPPQASIAVGLLTIYLVVTALRTARQREAGVTQFDYAALMLVLAIAAALAGFGIFAALGPQRALVAPYLLFAAFAAFLAGLDIKVIRAGGIRGASRIARHLWRMCFALFFATSFFFIGQQKVMPAALRGSPILLALGFAPLAAMVYWLLRQRRARA